MHIILGGTGHVGSEAAKALLAREEPVTIVSHDPSKADAWRRRGAEIAIADVHDSEAVREVFRRGERAFLLNPPASPETDTDKEERQTVASILDALKGSGIEKVVAESTYGAQPGQQCGDLNVLYELEEGLKAQDVPASVIRAAYYMSNWDESLRTAREQGVVTTMLPEDLKLPMVAPKDLGRTAARLLTEPAERTGLHYVEGPGRYSPADVAETFSEALGRPVRVETIPRDKWEDAFRELGFSEPAARSYARMTAVTVDKPMMPSSPERGSTTLKQYVSELVGRDL